LFVNEFFIAPLFDVGLLYRVIQKSLNSIWGMGWKMSSESRRSTIPINDISLERELDILTTKFQLDACNIYSATSE
jgi:hypothetical protein